LQNQVAQQIRASETARVIGSPEDVEFIIEALRPSGSSPN
jgi:hypothetical protein